MILGIGNDLTEIGRIEKALTRAGFRERVFTADEQAYCRQRGVQAAVSYAARFAAKEAFVKALGTGFRDGRLLEIEVINNEQGRPELRLHGTFAQLAEKRGVQKIFLTLTHTAELAEAVVLLEGAE